MKILSLSLLLLSSLTSFSQWELWERYPAKPFDDGCVLQIDNQAWVGTGLGSDFLVKGRFFRWHEDHWEEESSVPNGLNRQYAAAVGGDQKAYLVGGLGNNFTFINDLWEFDALNQTWTELDTLPSAPRSGAALFHLQDKLVLVGGLLESGHRTSEVWSYDLTNQQWNSLPRTPFGSNWRAAYTQDEQRGYLLFGKDSTDSYSRDLYSYHHDNGWEWMSRFPRSGKTHASLVYVDSALFTLGGTDSLNHYSRALWKYDLRTEEWSLVDSTYYLGIRGGCMWEEDGYLHYVGGLTQVPLRTEAHFAYNLNQVPYPPGYSAFLFPNPASEVLRIQTKSPIDQVEIIDMHGRRYDAYPEIQSVAAQLTVEDLPPGRYIVLITTRAQSIVRSLLIQH